MTSRAFPLHEEVVSAMYAERVDPMERTYHASSPRLQQEEVEEIVPSYRSTNLDFWKGFNKNQKYLQAKSAADLRKTAARKQREKRRPPPRKTNPLLLARGKPTQRELMQDQRTPARNLACKMPPPVVVLGGGAGAGGGPVYEVEDLLRFARKKPGPHTATQLVQQDDRARSAAGGVVYQAPHPDEEEQEQGIDKDKERRHKKKDKIKSDEEEDEGGGGRASSREKKAAQEEGGEEQAKGQLEASNSNSNGNNPFQESFTSNSLEKHSFASGTVVPSLNLSAVVASQISDSQSQTKKQEDGEEEDKKTVDENTDDNQTAESAFGFDENNTNGNNTFGQQPSFAFTEGGNEDFLFARSMMDDEGNTFATNTLMGDDQTKATLPTTCHGEHDHDPARGQRGRGASAKQRRRQKREREAKRQLLRPVKGLYGDIGSSVKGGQVAQAPSRPPPERGLTQMCTYSTVKELEAGAGKAPKGGSFPLAHRFPAVVSAGSQRQAGAMPPPLPASSGLTASGTEGGVFSGAKRFTDRETHKHNPGPGDYTLGRLFEEKPGLSADRAEELVQTIEGERLLRNQNCNFMATQVVFGYGCSVQEHIKYGLCLDGLCGRRAKWEDVTLLAQDRERLGHGGGLIPGGGGGGGGELSSPKSKDNKNKNKNKNKFSPSGKGKGMSSSGSSASGSGNVVTGAPPSVSVNMRLTRRVQSSIEELRRTLHPGEDPDFSPLKTASLRGDFDTIVQLCVLGADINERDKLQETVLHQAVLRNYLHVIVCLTEVQGYSECLSEELKDICRHRSGGMFVQGAEHELNLDAQNHQGNTALHIAAMRGNGLMAEALCDAGVTPDGIKNNAGLTASDVAKTQRLFQIVKMAHNKHEAKRELRTLRHDRREAKQSKLDRESELLLLQREEEEEANLQGHEREEEDTEEVSDYEVYEEEEEEEKSEDEEEEEQKEGAAAGAAAVVVLPVSKHADQQHSYHVSYFGSPQVFAKKQSQREKYARFLNMRR